MDIKKHKTIINAMNRGGEKRWKWSRNPTWYLKK